MNNIAEALTQALARAKSLNSGTLSYNGNSCTVYTGWLRDQSREMVDAGYEATYDDRYVMASPGDVEGWGLQPMTSEVTLDGVAYMLGRTINKTSAYWTIYLRIKK